MKLQVVYDVISSMDNLYFEQAWASAWSLKHYNPDAYVVLLTDEATSGTIETEERREALQVIDEVRVVDFDGDYIDKEKSRWIKTNMRNLVKGDFLFIDADTIITGKLDGIEKTDCAVGAVLDNHCHSKEISTYPIFRTMYSDLFQQIYGVNYKEDTDVYNSGVLWVREVSSAYEFFNAWHRNWLVSQSKGECRDQLSMTKTIQDMNSPITELPGKYNCQIRSSVQYLHDALIVHTFSRQEDSAISPLFGYQLYRRIRQDKCITDEAARLMTDCKRCFNSPSFLTDKRWMEIRFQPSFILLDSLLKSTCRMDATLLKIINFLSRAVMWAKGKIE